MVWISLDSSIVTH